MRNVIKETIGFVGVGIMGSQMANRLIEKEYLVNVFTRTREKAVDLLDNGAVWKDSVKQLAEESDVIFTMVGIPEDVEEIYFGQDGILENSKSGTLLIDMTTSKPSLAKRIAEVAEKNRLISLDGPVSGGVEGAEKGTLTIMVGGSRKGFERALPILQQLGRKIVHTGQAGSGQLTKACNQLAMANQMVGVCEVIVLAKKAGLDPESVIDLISTGTAQSWVMENLAYKMIKGDYRPGFQVKHLVKDLKIAKDVVGNTETPSLDLSLALFEELERSGEGENGTRVIMKMFESGFEQSSYY